MREALIARFASDALEDQSLIKGMPMPANLDTAVSLETILRAKGVTPATIAFLDGKVYVGLSEAQLTRLADTANTLETRVKVSRRDMGPALASKLVGGTTVASTMFIGQSVGIPLFVTGGIGGVHRGAENSMDVSADLIELGRTASRLRIGWRQTLMARVWESSVPAQSRSSTFRARLRFLKRREFASRPMAKGPISPLSTRQARVKRYV